MSRTLVLIDQSKSIDPHELADVAEALTTQLQNEFRDEYDVDVNVRIGDDCKLASEHPLYLVNSSQLPNVPAGALGWHDDHQASYVCLDFCKSAGVSWSSCASHEACEYALDPTAIYAAQCADGLFRALESSDAVEQDTYVVTVQSGRHVELSNFVHEAWFTGRGAKFDHLGLCTSALEIRPGGYCSIFDPSSQQWTQQQAPSGLGAYRRAMADAGHSRHAIRAARALPPVVSGIIDVFHGDADAIRKRGLTLTEALRRAKLGGVRMVIAKATQGRGDYTDEHGVVHHGYIDPSFHAWIEAIRANGLIPGAYAFPSMTSSPEDQCDFFLATVGSAGLDPAVHFCALDKERNPNPGGTITREHARAWVQRFRDKTGRWPVYYTNTSDAHADIAPDDVIRNCLLWAAYYGEVAHGIPTPWPPTLIQYMGAESGPGEWPSDAKTYPREFDGVGKVDASVFIGTPDCLRAAWPMAVAA